MVTVLTLLAIVLILAFLVVGIYNRLVGLRNRVENAWRQIDVQLQRRYDLIPNLVEAVKGYMEYEKSTLESVIQARGRAVSVRESIQKEGAPSGGTIKQLMAAESALKGSLGNIFALAENYPDLKASKNMQQLQEELTSTENKVAFSRQAYNDQVMIYNTAQQQFPAVLFAGMFGHKTADLFEAESEEAKQAVKVSFTK